jgi:hypothetical protein
MPDIARKVGRFAIAPLLAGAAVFGLAAPAVAAPPAPGPSIMGDDCRPVDGVKICVVTNKTSDKTLVSALIRSDGPKMKGVFLLLEACGGDCHTQEIATGKGVGELRTKAQEWGRGTGYYRVNASWVDDKGVAHTGVVYPEY